MGQTTHKLDLPRLLKKVAARKVHPDEALAQIAEVFKRTYARCPRCQGPISFGQVPEPEEGIAAQEALEAPPPGQDEVGQAQDRRGIEIDAVKAEELRSRWEGTTISPEVPWSETRIPGTYRFQVFSDDKTGADTNSTLGEFLMTYGPDSTLWVDAAETHIIVSDNGSDQGSHLKQIASHESHWPWK